MNILFKRNGLFTIDETKLAPSGRNNEIKAALYGAVYEEFLGASQNPKYKDLSPLDRFNRLNDFATTWLQDRGLLNG